MKEKTFVYELITGITSYTSPGDGHMKEAEILYKRYLGYMWIYRKGVERLSFPQFLLTKIEPTGFDSFIWTKDTLVKVKETGKIGLVTGWCPVGITNYRTAVSVRTASGEGRNAHGTWASFRSDQIEKAEVTPEVLEYVASTLRTKVHGKVDEAFENKE